MAKLGISTGSSPNDGTGDSLIDGAVKANSNFTEIYTAIGDGTTLAIPVTSVTAGTGINLSGSTGSVTITNTGIANTNNLRTDFLEVSGISTLTGVLNANGGVVGNVTGSSSQVTVSDESSDTTCFPLFATAATGNLPPKSGSNLTFNSSTGSLTATQFVGGGAGVTGISTLNITNYGVGLGGGGGGSDTLASVTARGATTSDLIVANGNIQVGAALNLQYSGNTSTILHNNLNGSFDIQSVSGINLKPGPSNVLVYDTNDVLRFKTTTEGANIYGNLSVGIGSTEVTNTPSLTLSHNNPTVAGTSGTTGNIKSIGGAPFYYDGTNWREFVLATGTPVSQPEDTDWDNVIFRNDFDTSLTEQRFGQTVYSGTSNVDLVSSPVKVGTKSARIGYPNNGGLAYPKRSEYDFTGAWTIEGWFYLDNVPAGTGVSATPLVAHTYLAASTWGLTVEQISGSLYFRWLNNSSSSHSYNNTGGRGTQISGAHSISLLENAWAHIALVRKVSNGSLHLFVNGTESANTASDQIIDNDIPTFTNSYELWFGKCRITGTNDIHMDGNIDDIRISTSQRYTSNFNPPTTALPISGTGSTTYTLPGSLLGEISLGGSPSWTGTTGVTASQVAAGQYRATFATAYSSATDYVIQTSMNDYTPATTPVGIGVSRFTTHADFFVRRVSDGANIDTGSLAIDLFKK